MLGNLQFRFLFVKKIEREEEEENNDLAPKYISKRREQALPKCT